MIYYFTQPFLKQSTKKVHQITTEQQEVVGGIQRYYKTPLQRWVDFVLDGFFLNCKVYDQEGKLIVEAVDKLTLIRDSWDIIEDGNRHHLKCVTKIRPNPRYILSYHGEQYIIQRDFMDKYIRIKDINTEKVISEYEYLTLTPPRRVKINIMDPALSIYVVICLCFILSTKYH